MTRRISQDDFLAAYMNMHSNKRGESFKTNADRLFEWLKVNHYIEVAENLRLTPEQALAVYPRQDEFKKKTRKRS